MSETTSPAKTNRRAEFLGFIQLTSCCENRGGFPSSWGSIKEEVREAILCDEPVDCNRRNNSDFRFDQSFHSGESDKISTKVR